MRPIAIFALSCSIALFATPGLALAQDAQATTETPAQPAQPAEVAPPAATPPVGATSWLLDLRGKREISLDDAFRAVLALNRGYDRPDETFDDRVLVLLPGRYFRSHWNLVHGDEARATRGQLAYMLLKTYGVHPGAMGSLFRRTERYAYRDFVDLGVIPDRGERFPLSGRELIAIMAQAQHLGEPLPIPPMNFRSRTAASPENTAPAPAPATAEGPGAQVEASTKTETPGPTEQNKQAQLPLKDPTLKQAPLDPAQPVKLPAEGPAPSSPVATPAESKTPAPAAPAAPDKTTVREAEGDVDLVRPHDCVAISRAARPATEAAPEGLPLREIPFPCFLSTGIKSRVAIDLPGGGFLRLGPLSWALVTQTATDGLHAILFEGSLEVTVASLTVTSSDPGLTVLPRGDVGAGRYGLSTRDTGSWIYAQGVPIEARHVSGRSLFMDHGVTNETLAPPDEIERSAAAGIYVPGGYGEDELERIRDRPYDGTPDPDYLKKDDPLNEKR